MNTETQLLKLSLNRWNKFHARKLHKVKPNVELSSDDRFLVNKGPCNCNLSVVETKNGVPSSNFESHVGTTG